MSGKNPVYYKADGVTVLRVSTTNSGTETDADKAVMKPGANGYRLPTEAEWEYAARGGNGESISADKWAGTNEVDSLETYAWYGSNAFFSGDTANIAYGAHPVGTKSPNGKGLYDMSGNVREWCWDWYNSDVTGNDIAYGSSVTNPAGPGTGSNRVIRGGSWSGGGGACAISLRSNNSPDDWYNNLGFRVACRP
jgi:formylglycine-generating enzyme required for sulfatase activity